MIQILKHFIFLSIVLLSINFSLFGEDNFDRDDNDNMHDQRNAVISQINIDQSYYPLIQSDELMQTKFARMCLDNWEGAFKNFGILLNKNTLGKNTINDFNKLLSIEIEKFKITNRNASESDLDAFKVKTRQNWLIPTVYTLLEQSFLLLSNITSVDDIIGSYPLIQSDELMQTKFARMCLNNWQGAFKNFDILLKKDPWGVDTILAFNKLLSTEIENFKTTNPDASESDLDAFKVKTRQNWLIPTVYILLEKFSFLPNNITSVDDIGAIRPRGVRAITIDTQN